MIERQCETTFAVDDVEPATAAAVEIGADEQLSALIGTEMIASSASGRLLHEGADHPLLGAVYKAFNEHRPLVLAPDHIWLTITRGIADHMRIEGEALRSRFVRHAGQLTLGVQSRTTFEQTDWPAAFADWCRQIAEHVGADLHQALVADFSTTTNVERIASHVVMMDIFEKYFKYECVGICGIPTVTLRGSVEDWKRLRAKAAKLEVFEVGWWLEHLIHVLDQFVSAAGGKPDVGFWQRICKLREEYGGHIINGWITTFFAYLRDGALGPADQRNWTLGTSRGLQIWNTPNALSFVPITWRDAYSGRRTYLRAVGGLIGVKQHPSTLALEPVAGWAVARETDDAAMTSAVKEFALAEPVSFSQTPDNKENLPGDMIRFYTQIQACRFPEYAEGAYVEIHGWQSLRPVELHKHQKVIEELGLYQIGAVNYPGPELLIALGIGDYARKTHRIFLRTGDDPKVWPVVAESFAELLIRLSNERGRPWWIDSDWKPLRLLKDCLGKH